MQETVDVVTFQKFITGASVLTGDTMVNIAKMKGGQRFFFKYGD